MNFSFQFDTHHFNPDDIELIIWLTEMILLPILILTFAVAIVFHCIKAAGLSKIAAARGMAVPYLAWIPVIGAYIQGAVSDDINSKKGKKTYWGLINLAVSLLYALMMIFSSIFVSILWREIGAFLMNTRGMFSESELTDFIMQHIGGILVFSSITMIITAACTIVHILTLNNIFKEYTPDSAVVKTVVCALLTVLFYDFMSPCFLFAMRGKQPFVPYDLYGGGGNGVNQNAQQIISNPQSPDGSVNLQNNEAKTSIDSVIDGSTDVFNDN
ncbi:MAG: hypothetical protein FWG69_03180 [Oscillospiraceae bacterium]|nr:hypothetical protein [Oscillospiraceae bacterium]